MPSRGSWLELEIDKKGVVYARIDRKRKLPITTLLRALPAEDPSTGFKLDTTSNEAILKLFDDSHFIQSTLEKDTTTREEEALIEVFKKQRPGEPPTLDNARNLLRSLFFDPKRYDLTKVGRYKLNQRLGVDVPEDTRVLTTLDILALVQKLVALPHAVGVPEDSKDFAADSFALDRRPIATPEGPNIGLIGSLASMATVSEFGFIQTPYRKVVGGKVTDEIVYLDAAEEAQYTIAQASEPVDEKTGKFAHEHVLCRSREGEAVMAAPKEIQFMDVSPAQIVSVATGMIPFLEHNDANRALMGANMQRQAVPLMIPQAPLVR